MKTEVGKMLVLDASRLVREIIRTRPKPEVIGEMLNGYHNSMKMEMNSLEGPIIESIPGWSFRYSHSNR